MKRLIEHGVRAKQDRFAAASAAGNGRERLDNE